MSRYSHSFGRRQFLVGAAGLLAIPTLESLVPRSARAAVSRSLAADTPQRLVLVHSCHGWTTSQWVPAKTGVDFPLTPILQSLQNVKDKVLVLSKMQNDAALQCTAPAGADSHARGHATLFTGANVIAGGAVQVGPSMDQIYAQHLAGKTPVGSLQLGLAQQSDWPGGYPGPLMQCISYADKTTALSDQIDPKMVFDKYFAGATTSAAQKAQGLLRQQRKSVLDAALDQADALKTKLGKDDAEKLDQYFTSVRALEVQFGATTNVACGASPGPIDSVQTAYDLRANAFMDLIVLAFSCDLTRSVSFNFGSGHNDHRYSFLPGGVSDGHHQMTHNMNGSGVASQVTNVNAWEVSVAARMLNGLKQIKEGSATMLDNSVTLISSEHSIAGQHGYQDLPVVIVGGAGGKIDGNRHVQVGTGSNYGNLTEAELGILQALGVNITTFGGFGTTRAMSLRS